MHGEFQKYLMDGADSMDATALRLRLAQVSGEMKQRSKWEKVRLLEALKTLQTELVARVGYNVQLR